MTSVVHRAVFGEEARKHGLRVTSLSGSKQLGGLAARTDRPSAEPPPGATISAYLSGFPHEQWYVLVRTFPDATASRGGMVRSLCLLLDLEDVWQIHNLMDIVKLLPSSTSTPEEWAAWETAAHADTSINFDQENPATGRVGSEVLGLATRLVEDHRPAVWTGTQESFECALATIWANLPPSLRPRMRFGYSHAPIDLPSDPPHAVTSPLLAAPRWHDKLVTPLERADTPMAARLLVGDPFTARLASFVSNLPDVNDFAKLKRAQTCWMWLNDLSHGDQANALSTGRLLRDLAPAPEDVPEHKTQVLTALMEQLLLGDANTARRFANFKADAFSGGATRLRAALETRAAQFLTLPNEEVDKVVARVTDSDIVSWWEEGVSAALNVFARDLNVSSAVAVWRWWTSRPALVPLLLPKFLPGADLALSHSAPQDVTRPLAQELADAVPSSFVRLSVIAWAALQEPEMAFTRVLNESPRRHEGLKVLRTRIGDAAFLSAAMKTPDVDAWHEAGAAVRQTPTLLSNLNPYAEAWRNVWSEAVRLGLPPLTSVPDPQQIVNSTFDVMLSGESIPVDLLVALSQTSYANLLNYDHRERVWSVLPSPARQAFLAVTARALLLAGPAQHILELPLALAALDPQRLAEMLRDHPTRRVQIIQTYLQQLVQQEGHETHAVDMVTTLQHYQLTLPELDIQTLSNYVRERSWRGAAEAALAAAQATPTPTLRALTTHTAVILPALRRLEAYFFLRRPNVEEEYFAALHATLTRLFHRGPQHEGVWEDAGGDPSDLPTHGSASEAWREAIRLARQGKVALPRLLTVSRRRYGDDSELVEFERLAGQLQK